MNLKKIKDFYFSLNVLLRRTYMALWLMVIGLAIINICMIATSKSIDTIFVLGVIDFILLVVSMIIYALILIKAVEFGKRN